MDKLFDDDGWALENFSNAYRNWLVSEMDGYSHRILFDQLYETEYRWSMERDGDRASDGVHLRVRFEYESGLTIPDGWYDWPCSFLEMIVSMAYSIQERIMYDPDDEFDVSYWFWMMLGNCGLDAYDDETMLDYGKAAMDDVDVIVNRVMDRRYSRNGVGGLFPMVNPSMDQRKVEYWYQMNEYMMERGYV